ncbi:hypothetical protein [Paenisporosarcina sp.]|uniref:hypothetical protein n=1 Tax=Paenisporosarcina sp. TaxID=1932001 RepID=UPI003C714EF2
MKGTHFLWISTAHALVFTSILGFLHVFKFIKWHPLNWTDNFQIFPHSHVSIKWMLTFLIVFFIINIVTGLFLLVKKMPAIATSIVVGFAVWLLLEWAIYKNFSHIKWHSIPMLTVILLICRALAETIVYYDRTVYDDERK